jgi:RES domain-containing protein
LLTGAALDAAVLELAAASRPLRATYHRALFLAHANDPLGVARPITEGRFNIDKGARILYTSDEQLTCLDEAQLLGVRTRGLAVIPVECRLKAVIDLRDPAVQALLGTTSAELSANFRALARPAPTQLLGEACAATGRIDGLQFESAARPGHHNLAVIEGSLALLNSSVQIADPTLPPAMLPLLPKRPHPRRPSKRAKRP